MSWVCSHLNHRLIVSNFHNQSVTDRQTDRTTTNPLMHAHWGLIIKYVNRVIHFRLSLNKVDGKLVLYPGWSLTFFTPVYTVICFVSGRIRVSYLNEAPQRRLLSWNTWFISCWFPVQGMVISLLLWFRVLQSHWRSCWFPRTSTIVVYSMTVNGSAILWTIAGDLWPSPTLLFATNGIF